MDIRTMLIRGPLDRFRRPSHGIAPETSLLSLLVLAVLIAGCATAVPRVRLDEGAPPSELQKLHAQVLEDARVLEALWGEAGMIDHEADLAQYMAGLGSRLAPENSRPEEIKYEYRILKSPIANAYALYHGRIYITTALLSELRNEDQLAFILGHEIAHIVNRDMLYFTKTLHNKTIAAKLLDLAVAPAGAFFGVPGASLAHNLIYAASITGYSRADEARADREGIEMQRQSGYDSMQIPAIVEKWIRGSKRYKSQSGFSFLASHADNEERLKAMLTVLGLKDKPPAEATIDDAFLASTEKARLITAREALRVFWYQSALDCVEDVLSRNSAHHEALFLKGEAYRLMAENRWALKEELSADAWHEFSGEPENEQIAKWQSAAHKAYAESIAAKQDYPDSHRGLGLLYLASQKNAAAAKELSAYLDLSPNPVDQRFIMSKLRQIGAWPPAGETSLSMDGSSSDVEPR